MESIRRKYLNQNLKKLNLKGKIIDIGGKKYKKRSDPKLDLKFVNEFLYLNTDKSTNPDIIANAEKIPCESEYFDNILLIEVLEHLENPKKVLKECYRILKKNGVLYMSIPFLYPIHADPYDFQRWSPTKINLVLKKLNFTNIQIYNMGGMYAVINDLIRFKIVNLNEGIIKKILVRVYSVFILSFFMLLDKVFKKNKSITTGYFVVAKIKS